jgi:23S rRNA U2552 (ribose-2'-O)-methylase RlmE/FtsJ
MATSKAPHKAPHDYVVIVHLNHATRVCAALSGNDVYYLTTNNPLSRPKRRFRSIRNSTFANLINCKSPISLPPHGRQNISHVVHVPHKTVSLDQTVSAACQSIQSILTSSDTFSHKEQHKNNHSLILRINTFPKSLNVLLFPLVELNLTEQKELGFTRSASKATHVLSVVQVNNSDDFRWGLINSQEAKKISSSINENAAKECTIFSDEQITQRQQQQNVNHTGRDDVAQQTSFVPALTQEDQNSTATSSKNDRNDDDEIIQGNSTSLSLANSNTSSHYPVSRAYFKMQELIDTDPYFTNLQNESNSHSTGIDLGASPGGWTQALRYRNICQKMISIDPGLLSKRVLKMKNILHIQNDFRSDESINILVENAPYKFLVCDANIDPLLLLEMIQTVFSKVNEKLIITNPKITNDVTKSGEERKKTSTKNRLWESGGCVLEYDCETEHRSLHAKNQPWRLQPLKTLKPDSVA